MEAVFMAQRALLGPLFESLSDSLKNSELLTYASGRKFLEEVKELEPMLKTISAMIEDAEEMQMRGEVDQKWINDIRYLAYDVEDMFDELIVLDTQSKFLAETRSSFQKLLQSGLSFTTIGISFKIARKVKVLSEQFENMKTQIDSLKNTGGRNNRVYEKRLAGPLHTASLVEPNVCGRETDYKAILEMMKNEACDGGVSVIAIVGMGGVGKTTLAQMVFNDESLQFDVKAWASIGEVFDIFTVTKTIVESEGGDLNFLQSKLRDKLSGKKFLVVLDDLWSDDYDEWTRFYRPFVSGARGSKIIITTRSNKVSLATSSRDGYVLQSLSYNDSLSLFARHALDQEDFIGYEDLMQAGREIVKRCSGLPLAVKALGGLLRGKPYCNVWKKLLQNNLWEEDNNVLPLLRLSYNNLSSKLKRCFAYCAIFPKDYEFIRDDLVLLWLAEGFPRDLSDAYTCFDELFARSFFHKSAKDTSVFLMHGLIHDLARFMSGGVCLNLDEKSSSRKNTHVRHLAFNRGELDVGPIFENFEDMKCLRTILALPIFKERRKREVHCISSEVLDVCIPKLRFLKVLSLSGYEGVELPNSIHVLQHLRYLNMGYGKIVTLPDSMCKLFNLLVLILRDCKNLRKLPGDFCNLINLQCVDLSGTDSLEEMPLHIGNLSKLLILTKFIVGSGDGSRIKELLKITNLEGEVHVKELQNVVNTDYSDCLRMIEKENIDGLVLEWTHNFGVNRDMEKEKKVLEDLQPQKNIARMSVKSYGGMEFPSWFGNDSFKLTVLEMYNCRNVSSLPPLGQLPSLKELSIEGMSGVKEVGVEIYGVVSSSSYSNVFPSLEILNFKDMENWEVWSCFNNVEHEERIFPKLKKLGIRCCPELIGDIPKGLVSLEELVIEGCNEVILKRMPNLEPLTKMEISNISGLESFQEAFPRILKSLQELKVSKCGELQHLWENGTEIETFECLKELKISECTNLISFVEGEEGIFPSNLHLLYIYKCDKLERLPNQLHCLTFLATLWIERCPKLKTFGDLPNNVKEVKIIHCDSLERLPKGIVVDQNQNSNGGQFSCIEELELRNVKPDSLTIPPIEVFPSSLKSLSISEGLEMQLLESLQLQNHFSSLTTLVLEGSLESFSATGLPIPTLLCFKIGPCENLRSLPCNMHNLTSLKTLRLFNCPKLESFPERGMPPSLSELSISYCNSLGRQPLSKWKLDRLSYLQNLIIIGDMEMIHSFPHDSLPLPFSLTTLCINGFQNLKSISSLLRYSSLQELYIECCPKLQHLPKEDLPPSLGCIYIDYCPLLEKQFITGDVKVRVGLRKNVDGRNDRVNMERLARPLTKPPLVKPKVYGSEDDHKIMLHTMNPEGQFIDDSAEINPLGAGPSLREQHAGRRRPGSEECVSFMLLGRAPTIQLMHSNTSEPTAASNSFRRYDLVGCYPSMDHVPDDLVTCFPSPGLQGGLDLSMNHERDDLSRHSPENSSRYDNFSHHGPTGSYHSTTLDEEESTTRLRCVDCGSSLPHRLSGK